MCARAQRLCVRVSVRARSLARERWGAGAELNLVHVVLGGILQIQASALFDLKNKNKKYLIYASSLTFKRKSALYKQHFGSFFFSFLLILPHSYQILRPSPLRWTVILTASSDKRELTAAVTLQCARVNNLATAGAVTCLASWPIRERSTEL